MTICLGALAANSRAIVCVADKGLYYGNGIQWDSASTKIVPVGSSDVRALISGGELMISRVLHRLQQRGDLGRDVPQTMIVLEEDYQSAESEVIEAAFLKQHMMTSGDYNQAVTSPEINSFIKSLAEKIEYERIQQNYTGCGIILCGFDSNKSPFILHVDSPGLVTDLTHTGYGAVGSGSERAISRLL